MRWTLRSMRKWTEAVEFAEASPEPTMEDLYKDVYADELNTNRVNSREENGEHGLENLYMKTVTRSNVTCSD